MSRPAILADRIGKRYLIGAKHRTADTLRETISNAAARTWAGFARLGKNDRFSGLRAKTEDFWALRDVSFEVPRGQVLGIIGRNGSGKSTLLKILSRITPPTEGEATIVGRVGTLLEIGTGFHGELTGRENIFLSGTILGMKTDEITRRFDEIVDFSGVEKFIDTPVKRYSSGMYLRLAFAVAAHLRTEILLIDEVLAVGDASFQKKCIERMSEAASEGRTVLFVSHNLGAVSRLCDRGILLDGGRISVQGPVDSVVAGYDRFLSTRSDEDESTGLDGVTVSPLRLRGSGDGIRPSTPLIFAFALSVKRRYWQLFVQFGMSTHGGLDIVIDAIDSERNPELIRPGRHHVEVALPPLWLQPRGYASRIKVIAYPETGSTERYYSEWLDIVVIGDSDAAPTADELLMPETKWTVGSDEHG